MVNFSDFDYNKIDKNLWNQTTTGQGSQTPAENNIEIKLVETPPLKDEKMGLGVEKTNQNQPVENKVEEKTEKPEQNQDTKKTTKKTGESVNERLSRYYDGYDKSTREEKEKYLDRYITGHFKSLKGMPKEQRIKLQIADYKKLLDNTKDPDDYEMLAARINILEKENQVSAAKRVAVEEPDETLRHRGQIGVARTVHSCHKDNQTELTQIVVDSKNEQAIQIGASNSSKTDVSNQTEIVDLYMNADISEKGKVNVGKTIVDQYGDFAKENQVNIHKSVSSSKISEIVEYAADNIWHMHKDNQKPAVDVTIATGNEAAINKAASRANYYDESAKEAIKTAFYNSGYESAKSNWDNAPAKVETATSAKSEKTPSTSTSSSTKTSVEVKSAMAQVKELTSSGFLVNQTKMNEILKNATPAELKQIFMTLSPTMKVQAIKIMLANGASLKDLGSITEIISQGGISDKDKKEIYESMSQNYSTNVMATQSTFSNDVSFVRFMHQKGNIDLIEENKLSGLAKKTFFELNG